MGRDQWSGSPGLPGQGGYQMIAAIVETRILLSIVLSSSAGLLLFKLFPFPDENAVLQLILWHKPLIFAAIKYLYLAMLFTTPFIGCSISFSLLYIFFVRHERRYPMNALPPYPEPRKRDDLFLIIGELHHPRQPVPAEHPQWLTIPQRGLFTGIAVFGAIGSGKTTCCPCIPSPTRFSPFFRLIPNGVPAD